MKAILLIILLFTLSVPSYAKYFPLNKGTSDHAIIFIHGLMGDPIVSFTNTESEDSWADLLAKDRRDMKYGPKFSDYTIGALGFPSGNDSNLSIVQIANRLQTDLVDAHIFDKHEHIFLIAHSLGGLVAKEIYNNLQIMNEGKFNKFTGIFLIATPSQGSQIERLITDLPDMLDKPLVIDMQPIDVNTHRQSVEIIWGHHLRQRKTPFPRIYCAYETKETAGMLVVPMGDAATYCDDTPRAEDKDHFSIVRPKTSDDSIYRWVRGRIAATLRITEDIPPEDKAYTILISNDGGSIELTTVHPLSMMLNLLGNLQNLQTNPLGQLGALQSIRFSVIAGTKIKILEYPPDTDKRIPPHKLGKYVEILEGEHKGRKGWVSKGNIQRKMAN